MRTPAARDLLGRSLRDLRISVTDRCNFRCGYCMPKEVFKGFPFLPRSELLSFEEITRIARVFARLGVTKLRLTGGEPLLRRDLPVLVAMLREIGGITDIALTTNGSLLARHTAALRSAGLDRVTVSLDALDDGAYRLMNDADVPVVEALAGIQAAHSAGFSPIKINMVVRRGMNDDRVVAMADRFKDRAYVVRFIEYMDVGTTNGWRLDEVVSGAEIIALLSSRFALAPLAAAYPGEVAKRFQHRIGGGEIGVITSVTQPFCGDCSRARLSSDGKIYTCLFSADGHDLRAPLREGASDAQLEHLVRGIWTRRQDRYSELRGAGATAGVSKVEMSRIGG